MTNFRLTIAHFCGVFFTFAVSCKMPTGEADDHAANRKLLNMPWPAIWPVRRSCSMWRAPVRVWSWLASLAMCFCLMIMAKTGDRRPPFRRAIHLVGVTFIDNQTGYAVGHAATILKTVDGGDNWTLQYNERRARPRFSRCILPMRKTALRWAVFPTHLKPIMAVKAGRSALWSKTAMMIFI